MSLRIIHVLSNIERVNFGIWNAALFAHEYLARHNVESIAVVCTNVGPTPPTFPKIPIYFLGSSHATANVRKLSEAVKSDKSRDIYVTHGCWLMPSRVGYLMSLKGYRWVYTPHGMLEQWSMALGKWKKKIYYRLFEQRYARYATRVRAVSRPEQQNLAALLDRTIDLIYNGVHRQASTIRNSETLRFLFLGRLHFKKGILPLAKAWKKELGSESSRQLVIAGPDEGELASLRPYINGNIEYVGPVYGDDKVKLLKTSHYFLLPSFSEGFPVSAIEAMSYGLIPLISKGCNFDQVFDEQLGYRIEPDEGQISEVLRQLKSRDFDRELSEKNRQFIDRQFSEEVIGEQLLTFYNSIPNQEP